MSTYHRTTRECSVSELRPALYQAIRDYFQAQQLGDPETEVLMCCETTSTKQLAGRLASWLEGEGAATVHMGMLLTPQRLIWVRRVDDSGVVLTAADLKQIRVRAYSSVLTRDAGLEVFGVIGDSRGRVRGYIGMGSEAAAQKFCEAVIQAVEAVNPPVKRKLPKWLTFDR
ncbi:MAG: hypothetical protein JXR84_01475 [Anaerolineae bacterium]|nr:hypothetical protein [Anaerolineae bacterium]